MPTKRIGPGITEIEIPEKHNYGYFVRIARQGKHYRKFFSYARHGGKQKALRAAKQYYQSQLNSLPRRHRGTKNIKTVRNKTGKVGVHLACVLDKRWPASESWAYVAGWLDSDGNHIHVSFATLKYGDRGAWRRACIARDNQLRDRDQIEEIYQAEVGKKRKK